MAEEFATRSLKEGGADSSSLNAQLRVDTRMISLYFRCTFDCIGEDQTDKRPKTQLEYTAPQECQNLR